MYIYVSYWHLLLEFYIGNASKLCVDLGCFYDATNAQGYVYKSKWHCIHVVSMWINNDIIYC